MHINHLMTLSVATLLLASTSGLAAETSSSLAMNQLRKDHPRLRTMDRAGKIHKLVDKQLATGVSPKNTAENFISTWSVALDVDPTEFIERGPFPDGHSEQLLMFNPETGTHKFTGVYYMQTANGLPVYDSRLMVLVRNVEGYPAVASTTDLFDVSGFKTPRRAFVSEAVALMAAAGRLGKGVTISSPELMVFAGTENTTHVPTAALVFEATRGGHWDFDNFSKLELVVDVQTGSILHEKNLILHVDGNVSGMATESSGADVCEPESSMGMPYSKITLGGSTVYADVDGNYTVSGSGTITSSLDGLWFNLSPNATESQNSSNPNLVHNASNSSESNRASVNAYLHSNIVRDFTLLYAPDFPTIGNQQGFNVNTGVSGTCNAFYDGGSINFYNSGGGCSNTAFSVIVHHEYGHHLVEVAGSGQGAYGEGMGDVMGVLITGDPNLARGFYSNDCNNGIRNADNTCQYTNNCSSCGSAIHDCGQLISGCVWDTLAEMSLYPNGHSIVSTLAINSIMLHSGSGIDDSITLDWLVLDDDDGDLDTGTPHVAEINAGFGMHNMEIPMPAIFISYPNGRPTLFDPNGGTHLAINVIGNTAQPIEDSGLFHWNEGILGWQQSPLSPASNSDYEAIFPAKECGESLEWYVSFETTNAGTITNPVGGANSAWIARAGSGTEVTFEDNFQSNLGWSVTGNAGDGQWERGEPVGGGDRCDPATDADGSGSCYVTDNEDGNSDVDDGTTTLYSPTLDASNGGLLSYYRWYNNGSTCDGQDPQNDYFYVDISSDGGSSWMNLETVGPISESNGGWYFVEYDLSTVGGFEPSADFMIRFVCGDLGQGSVIEAGVDGVSLSKITCDEPTCMGDVNNDSNVNVTDLLIVVGAWGDSGGLADVNEDGTVNVSDLLLVVDAWGPCQ